MRVNLYKLPGDTETFGVTEIDDDKVEVGAVVRTEFAGERMNWRVTAMHADTYSADAVACR